MARSEKPVVLVARVSPRAPRNEIVGWTANSPRELAVRVCAPPEGGKANKAVCELVASSLGIAKSKISVKRGQSSRVKQLELEVSQAEFDAWAASLPVEQS